MNLDEYYLNEAYNHEDSKEYPDKVWLVVFDRGEDYQAFTNPYSAKEYYEHTKTDLVESEVGWIYETNLCSDFYKYFNVIKSNE